MLLTLVSILIIFKTYINYFHLLKPSKLEDVNFIELKSPVRGSLISRSLSPLRVYNFKDICSLLKINNLNAFYYCIEIKVGEYDKSEFYGVESYSLTFYADDDQAIFDYSNDIILIVKGKFSINGKIDDINNRICKTRKRESFLKIHNATVYVLIPANMGTLLQARNGFKIDYNHSLFRWR